MPAPDAGQAALVSLRARDRGRAALIAPHRTAYSASLRRSRPAICPAVPLYPRDRATPIHALAAVADGDVLRAGISDPDGFPMRFLEAVRREAPDGRNLLLILDRLVAFLAGSPGVK